MSRISFETFVNWRKLMGKDYRTSPSASRTPSNTPKHLWTLQNTLRHHKHIPQSTTNSFDFYKALVRQSKRHLSCQEMSGGTLWEMRVSEDVCWVSGIFVSVKAMSGLSWECLEISEGVWGVSRGIGEMFQSWVIGVMNKSLKNISLIGKYSQTMEYIPKEDFPNLRIFP